MSQKSNPLVRFLYIPFSGYTIYPYEEASPGITHLELGFSLRPVDGEGNQVFSETLLVPYNIPEYAIDLLLYAWTDRIALENDIDLNFSPVESDWFTFGNNARNRESATNRHEDLVQQAIADVKNGANPGSCVYFDCCGSTIQPGDTIRHNHYDVEYKVVDHMYSLAISVPQEGEPDLIIPFCQLAGADDSPVLDDWFNMDATI